MNKEAHMKDLLDGLTLEGLATYQIRIKGSLGAHWSDRLGGMRIATSSQKGQERVTELVGQLLDQAALLGVLNTLYDLHLPILSLTCLEAQRTSDEETPVGCTGT